MDVSIIIVNYRSWKSLERCLTSLYLKDDSTLSFEVIVVDNNSPDGGFEQFKNKFTDCLWIKNSGNHGFAHGCNLGAKHAKADHLLFLNPDTLPYAQSIQSLYKCYLDHPDIAIISPAQHNAKNKFYRPNKKFPTLLGMIGLGSIGGRKLNVGNELILSQWVSGSAVLLSKEWFDKVNGWNEDYWLYCEDVELCKKISQLQGKIAVMHRCAMMHEHGGSSRNDFKTRHQCKTEVIISKHIYIRNNFSPYAKAPAHAILIGFSLLKKGLLGLFSLMLFSRSKLKINFYILKNLFAYYGQALRSQSWLSIHSVKHPNNL